MELEPLLMGKLDPISVIEGQSGFVWIENMTKPHLGIMQVPALPNNHNVVKRKRSKPLTNYSNPI